MADLTLTNVEYQDGDTKLEGFIARPTQITGKTAAVLIVPEWWGITSYIKQRAAQIADLGYIAFVADMYGAGIVTESPERATELSNPFYTDRNIMRRRLTKGLDTLRAQDNVDTGKIAVIGYCFGGTCALELARMGGDVRAVVSFHGGLSTTMPATAGVIKAEILALNGGADPMVPPTEKDAFRAEMTAANATFNSIDYAGAQHAFTNPAATAIGEKYQLPIAYDENADKQSWDEMKKLFDRVLAA